ncbi:MAG: hypothetical protein IJF59_03045 [Clostridia bacterium]|nr:hypothetical protein [Clostridia bacterium]MBQ3077603.1 hypothetical protein [Clostridia bacterium]
MATRKVRRIPPSPCRRCPAPCKGDICPRWQRWFQKSWSALQEMFL